MLIIAVMVIFGMIKEILTSIAWGVFVILMTLKDRKINDKLALGIMALVYGVPAISYYFARDELKVKDQPADTSFSYIVMSILTIAVQIVIGYFVGKLIITKKVLKIDK